MEEACFPPPFLVAEATKRDGLAFVGLSLQRQHQNYWDLNMLQDRKYDFVATTNDDGWLVGGGESGEDDSFKLSNEDSAHVEIMRIGTFNPLYGGLPKEDLITALSSGEILIPSMNITPITIMKNDCLPPEVEGNLIHHPPIYTSIHFIPFCLVHFTSQILYFVLVCVCNCKVRFDMMIDSNKPIFEWKNWQIQFVKNQLFEKFRFPARFVPGPFHMTVCRKCTFRSEVHEQRYFENANKIIDSWSKLGAKPLMKLHLFKTRNEIIESFEPNFLGPYDTPENIEIIKRVLNVH